MKVQNPSGFVRFFIVIGAIMKENLLIDKSLAFASRIIKLYQYLTTAKQELVISKQIVRSGTSIGANINEANYGQSKADFISKMHIALKETSETEYWLRLLTMSEYLTNDMGDSLLTDCLELKRMLVASINTAKKEEK
jgi:four helix bundle protein